MFKNLELPYLHIIPSTQKLNLIEDNIIKKSYEISTAKNGLGEEKDSGKTPRGWHQIRAKIGEGCEINTVFVGRRPTGEILTPDLMQKHPKRDWITTRILWLSGLEVGKNRLGNVDTMQRYIYIHGTPYTEDLGKPASHGCIRMNDKDLIELFNILNLKTKVLIKD